MVPISFWQECSMVKRFSKFYREFERRNPSLKSKIYRLDREYDTWPQLFKKVGLDSSGETGEFIIVGDAPVERLNLPYFNTRYTNETPFFTDIYKSTRKGNQKKCEGYEVYAITMNDITDTGTIRVHYIQSK